MKIEAPWTVNQVAALNRWQKDGRTHPFTCGNDRMSKEHITYAKENGGDFGQLVASTNGWFCPVCSYRQTWAHAFTADPLPPRNTLS